MNDFFSPKILQCSRFITNDTCFDKRIVRDYEFDFYIDGEREIKIDNRYYKTSNGCMIFKKPGQIMEGKNNYNMFMLTLDFSRKSKITPEKYVRSSSSKEQELCSIDILHNIPEVFYPYHQDELINLYKQLCDCSYPNIIDEERQNLLITEFLLLILSDSYRYNREQNEPLTSKKNYVQRACNYINKNYHNEITIDILADYLSLNKNHLIKLFKKEISMTPNKYIKQTRLFYAKLMLIETEQSIENIGFTCGFNTPSYFIKCFKEQFGKSPLAYRYEHIKNTDINK